MKKQFFYLTLVLVSALTITSCASRKYGCPNTTGIKAPAATTIKTAA